MAVDLGPAAAVTEVGVQRVSEVKRRRARGQVDDLALWREDVNRFVQPGLLGIFSPVGNLVAPRQQLAQPGNLLLEGAFAPGRLARLLVAPVRGDAELRLAVHLLGADLHFERSAGRADHRGVQRLVEVSLRPRDVVVELLRDRLPQVVHHAECGIAVLHRRHNDAHGAHVVYLGEVERLAAHLVPDGVDVLRPPGDLRLDVRLLELARQRGDGPGDVLLALDAPLVEHLRDALVNLGFEVAERQVLELPLQLPDAEAVGERGIDIQGFPRVRNLLG